MFAKFVPAVLLAAAFAAPAHAQFTGADITTSPAAGQNYVVLGGVLNVTSVGCFTPNGFCVDTRGINLNSFARAQDVNSQFMGVSTQMGGLSSQFTSVSAQMGSLFSQLNALSSQMNGFQTSQIAMNAKIEDLLAVSTAMRDAVPNAGDRFAVRVNMGGYAEHVGGSIGASMNLNDSLRLSANFGQGHSYSAFSAGLNFSFN